MNTENENIEIGFAPGYSEEVFAQIQEMACVGYSISQIARTLRKNIDEFTEIANNPNSQVYRCIETGRLMSTLKMNLKLQMAAENGNITAIQQFEKLQQNLKVEQLKEKFFG